MPFFAGDAPPAVRGGYPAAEAAPSASRGRGEPAAAAAPAPNARSLAAGAPAPAASAPAPAVPVRRQQQQTAEEREEARKVADQIRNRRRSTSRDVNLKDTGGSTGRTISSLLGLGALGGLFSIPGSNAIADAPAGVTAVAPPTLGEDHHMVAYDKDGLKIAFVCRREADGSCTITATFYNGLDAPMTGFLFEAAVLKGVRLAVQPSTSAVLPPRSGSVSQRLSVVNDLAADKGLAIKFRISYSLNGGKVEDLGQVGNFPAGY